MRQPIGGPTRTSPFSFRWVIQQLRIKTYYGTSENAAKTQAWIAVSVYVLVANARECLALDVSLYKLLQLLSVMPLEKTPVSAAVFDVDPDADRVDTYTNRNYTTYNRTLSALR